MASPTTDRRLGLAGNTAYKAPADTVATSNVTLSGEQTIGGVAVLASNAAGNADRVLCVGQTTGSENGLWDVSTGSWTRSKDANGNYDLATGSQVIIGRGTYAGATYRLTTTGAITIGTTSLTWTAPATGDDTQIGWGAITSIVDGVLTRHDTLAAAVTAISTTRCAVVVRDDITMAASATFPTTATLQIENDAQITTTGFTLTVNGRFRAGPGQCFAGTGTVSFGAAAQVQMRSDWWPATAAGLQAALTAASGRSILVSGSYSLASTTLTVPSGAWLHAKEFSGTWSGNVTGLAFTSGGGIFGGTLTGAGNSSYNDDGRAIACFGTTNSPAAPTFVTAPVIQEVTITEWAGYGVFLGYTNRGSVQDCNITEIGYAGIAGVSCNDLLVQGNLVDGVSPGTSGDGYGIFVDRSNGTSETAFPRSYRVRIAENTVKNVQCTSNGQGIDTHGGVDFAIANNTIEGCEVGIFVTASVISGVQQLAPKRVTVTGNTIRGGIEGYGIQVAGAMDGATVNEYAVGIVVSGNTVEGHGISADGTSGAVRLQATRGLVVSNNTIRVPACNGIVLNTENIAFHFSGNTVVDPYDSTYASPACYFVDSINNSGVIASGSLYYQNSALGTNVATHCLRTDSTLTGLNIDLGRHILVNIDSTHLTFDLDTTTGINTTNFYEESGTTSLSAGSVVIPFNKRFPGTPVPMATSGSTHVLYVSAVNSTAVTIASLTTSSTTTIYWRAGS